MDLSSHFLRRGTAVDKFRSAGDAASETLGSQEIRKSQGEVIEAHKTPSELREQWGKTPGQMGRRNQGGATFDRKFAINELQERSELRSKSSPSLQKSWRMPSPRSNSNETDGSIAEDDCTQGPSDAGEAVKAAAAWLCRAAEIGAGRGHEKGTKADRGNQGTDCHFWNDAEDQQLFDFKSDKANPADAIARYTQAINTVKELKASMNLKDEVKAWSDALQSPIQKYEHALRPD